jgi:UDP-N-acetylmuramoyl-L-alanyl-D-glutamate--2,6-diaminopimelate ligase
MKLSALLEEMKYSHVEDKNTSDGGLSADPDIASIHYRSGDVIPGGLFIALKGQQADGHRYIDDAVSHGAAAVVVCDQPASGVDVPVIRVENTRKALATISSKYYGDPSASLVVIGITGTNGKTTTAYLIEEIFEKIGKTVGVIGTVNYRYRNKEYPNPLTTPESLDLQRILSEMRSGGVTHVIMEVSSHGVALDRIWNCWFDVGVFTNLSQDHLDFHGTMENYWSCKKMFFTDFLTSGPKSGKVKAVVNMDHNRGRELVCSIADTMPVIPVSQDKSGMVHPIHLILDQNGINGKIGCPGGEAVINSRLVGKFNLENILCAAGVSVAMDVPVDDMARGISSLTHVPGRLEPIANNTKRHVFVDYAHTPDALENVLTTLRDILPGRLICIFGCGGDRDKTKRPQMGRIVFEYADLAIITSDNPRTENPDAIIADILNGIKSSGLRHYFPAEIENGFAQKGFVVEPEREKAIILGTKSSREGDAILIAGKGHETYQIIGKQVFPFDDHEKAAKALRMN